MSVKIFEILECLNEFVFNDGMSWCFMVSIVIVLKLWMFECLDFKVTKCLNSECLNIIMF